MKTHSQNSRKTGTDSLMNPKESVWHQTSPTESNVELHRDSHLYQWALPAVTVTVVKLHCDCRTRPRESFHHWPLPADSVTVVERHSTQRQSSYTVAIISTTLLCLLSLSQWWSYIVTVERRWESSPHWPLSADSVTVVLLHRDSKTRPWESFHHWPLPADSVSVTVLELHSTQRQ